MTLAEIAQAARLRHRDLRQMASRRPTAISPDAARLRRIFRPALLERHVAAAPRGEARRVSAAAAHRGRKAGRKSASRRGSGAAHHAVRGARGRRSSSGTRTRPFFLYVAPNMPHVPLFVSDKFKGKSAHGLYGDVIMEIDWSVGEILGALKKQRPRRKHARHLHLRQRPVAQLRQSRRLRRSAARGERDELSRAGIASRSSRAGRGKSPPTPCARSPR